VSDTVTLKDTLDAISERKVREALRLARGSINVAAESLGVHRSTVYRLMRKYGIEITRIVA
jgi:transcriptional regulator of acetoin/glycerol metabolism